MSATGTQKTLRPADSLTAERFTPEREPAEIAIALALGACAALWLWPFFYYNTLGGDEGIAYQGAVRLLRGQIPYRDFFSFYTPGVYFLYAALFELFGVSIEAARTLLLGYGALLNILCYLLLRRTTGRLGAAGLTILMMFICLPSRFQNLHTWDSTVTALLAIYLAVLAMERKAMVPALAAGLFVGATAMIDQARGGGLVLGLVLAITFLKRIDESAWPARRIIAVIAGTAIPVVAIVIFFAWHHAVGQMLSGWLWPLQHYTAVNRMPFGYIYWSHAVPDIIGSLNWFPRIMLLTIMVGMMVASLLPLLVIAFTAYQCVKAWRDRQPMSELQQSALFLGLVTFGTFLAIWFTGRRDFLRMTSIAPLFFPLLPLLLDERLIQLPTLTRWRHLGTVFLCVSFFLYSLLMMSFAFSAKTTIHTRHGEVRVENPPDEVLAFIQAHNPEGTRVMVYPYASLYLFLSGTLSPTRYDFLQPGMHPVSDFEIAREQLERDRTKVVVFDLTFASLVPDFWPATPPEAIVHDPVTDFILKNYRPCRVLKGPGKNRPFLYMVREDLECPN